MKLASSYFLAPAALALALLSAPVSGGDPEVIYAPADQAEFKEVVPGIAKNVIWGDHDQGPYGAYTRFDPGVDNGRHIHSNDVWLMVLDGAYIYSDEDGEKRVSAGQFLRIPGGHVHYSGGDETEGALFYEESSGAFDLLAVE